MATSYTPEYKIPCVKKSCNITLYLYPTGMVPQHKNYFTLVI